MRGLAIVDDVTYVQTFQGINATIKNAEFALVFFGVVPAIILALATNRNDVAMRKFLRIAGLFFAVSVVGVTFIGNVPLNDELALVDGATLEVLIRGITIYSPAIYLTTDCDDPDACVVGAWGGDSATFTYTHSGETTLYYLIANSWVDMNDGAYRLTYRHNGTTCDHPVGIETTTWGGLKSLYR